MGGSMDLAGAAHQHVQLHHDDSHEPDDALHGAGHDHPWPGPPPSVSPEILNEESDLQNGDNPSKEVKDGSVVFENVSFSYAKEAQQGCLKNVEPAHEVRLRRWAF
ncbi:MAG: hypothetical protein ACLRWQ_13005 [Flavonifractor plautii]